MLQLSLCFLNKDRFDDPPEYGELRVYFKPTREIESFMLLESETF